MVTSFAALRPEEEVCSSLDARRENTKRARGKGAGDQMYSLQGHSHMTHLLPTDPTFCFHSLS